MLTLSRKEGQRIFIGDDIKVVVSKIRGNQVQISVEAPPEMLVDREEIRILRLQGQEAQSVGT